MKKRTVTYMTKDQTVKSSDIQEAVQQLKKTIHRRNESRDQSGEGDTEKVGERVK